MKTIYEDAYKNMVDELKKGRKKSCLTQADTAKRLGFSRQWIHKVESCEIRLDVFQLVRFCHVCGLKAYDLVRRMEEGVP
jgi:transcriptional regulator with XRE-family HTH domain